MILAFLGYASRVKVEDKYVYLNNKSFAKFTIRTRLLSTMVQKNEWKVDPQSLEDLARGLDYLFRQTISLPYQTNHLTQQFKVLSRKSESDLKSITYALRKQEAGFWNRLS